MTTHSSRDLVSLFREPELAAFVPLLYVAWADGELDMEDFHAVLRGESLSEKQREGLSPWLDPRNPPTSTELLRMHAKMREVSMRLSTEEHVDFIDLGLMLAKREGNEATRRAVAEVEEALGLRSPRFASRLFVPRPPVHTHFDEPEPPFEVPLLQKVLDGFYAEDWQWIRTVLQRENFRYRYDLDKEAYREQVLAWLQELSREGIGMLGMPRSVGGAARTDRFIKCFEALSMFDLSLVIKLGVQFGLFGGAILNLGNERQHQRYLGKVGRGELLGGFAMTELGHGSNVRELETTARFDLHSGAFVLHTPSVSARKEWIGNAASHGQYMVVFAQLESQKLDFESTNHEEDAGQPTSAEGGTFLRHGVHAFVVPVRDENGDLLPGVHIEDCGHKMGLNGVDNGRIWFDHVTVPRENLLDRHGKVGPDGAYHSEIRSPSKRFFTMLATLVAGRVSIASAALTASKSALCIAVRYGALRRQFGAVEGDEQCILDYPAHQMRLLPRLATTYALHFAITSLQERFREASTKNHGENEAQAFEAAAAGLKAYATWHAVDAAQQARECCGGMGFLTINRICQIRKDIDVFATFEGDNVVLMQLVAKSLLTGFSKEFKSDFFGALIKQLSRAAEVKLMETNPVASWRRDPSEMREAEFHQAAFRYRRERLTRSAARRMKKRIDDGMDGFAAFVEIQDHVLKLAHAHVEEQIHASFVAALEAMPAGAIQDQLSSLRALFGIWRLHEDRAWFLEHGYLDARGTKMLITLLSSLCQELRSSAVALVDAFGIPDEVLAAPIAFENYPENSMLGVRQ